MTELSGRFESWVAFQDHLTAGLAVAATEPADLFLCDTDYGHWPLGSSSTLDAFHQWVLSSRATYCNLLALSFDRVPAQHPKWVAWRQHWTHRVKCWQMPADAVQGMRPTFILKDKLAIRIMDPLSGRGIWSREMTTIRDWLSEIDVILQQSHEALPATTLGL